ncbi:hypothetical protein ACH79_16010 [Bradyrhizobium sp. CCBAU 051011]|uniref:helix-turn-helix transcriptional regulator n=1 Tax=Bradyrhizobium sp. CCBAU 051011 TaxID=858422 RepID=UPI001373BCF8|nr:AlpA family phage regulatory protein [Bradyrhizobium sp. CCBAU 051011]QHO78851.1 hypothetical protein ACH79_16010 [Bradyrhizobium sp. CCBAU 051011]
MIEASEHVEDELAKSASTKSGPRRMLNEAQVLAIVPVSPVTLWRMEKTGRFPRGSVITPNRKVWFEDEVIAWQNEINGRARGRPNHPSGSKS